MTLPKQKQPNRIQQVALDVVNNYTPYRRKIFLEAVYDMHCKLNQKEITDHLSVSDLATVARVVILNDENADELFQSFNRLFI